MAGMLAPAAVALSLAVRVYDLYGVPSAQRAAARVAVERVLRDADVTVWWTECPCDDAVGQGELVIRLAAAPAGSAPAVLGFSYVDLQSKAGTLATVFADRVHALADIAHADDGQLLGLAISHEIAHLLLGTRDHALVGLMRGQWTAVELRRDRQADWQLSRTQAVALRQGLVRRMRMPWRPAAMIADAEWPALAVSAP